MARGILKEMIKGLEVNASVVAPKNAEGITIRNYASVLGKEMGRRYSVAKDIATRRYTITRLA